MGQQIVLVDRDMYELESLLRAVFLSASHHRVMTKTWRRLAAERAGTAADDIWARSGEKRAIVSTLWLLLVLGERKAQVLAPGSTCY